MLVRTVISPSVFTFISEDKTAYSLLIRLLQDLEKTGVILVDKEDFIKEDLFNKIQHWSKEFNKFQIKAQKILKKLDDKNRIVKVSIGESISSICIEQSCQYCIGIAKDYLPITHLPHLKVSHAYLSNLKQVCEKIS